MNLKKLSPDWGNAREAKLMLMTEGDRYYAIINDYFNQIIGIIVLDSDLDENVFVHANFPINDSASLLYIMSGVRKMSDFNEVIAEMLDASIETWVKRVEYRDSEGFMCLAPKPYNLFTVQYENPGVHAKLHKKIDEIAKKLLAKYGECWRKDPAEDFINKRDPRGVFVLKYGNMLKNSNRRYQCSSVRNHAAAVVMEDDIASAIDAFEHACGRPIDHRDAIFNMSLHTIAQYFANNRYRYSATLSANDNLVDNDSWMF